MMIVDIYHHIIDYHYHYFFTLLFIHYYDTMIVFIIQVVVGWLFHVIFFLIIVMGTGALISEGETGPGFVVQPNPWIHQANEGLLAKKKTYNWLYSTYIYMYYIYV